MKSSESLTREWPSCLSSFEISFAYQQFASEEECLARLHRKMKLRYPHL
jgi:hypothetical protein